jgi:hypothetical protein
LSEKCRFAGMAQNTSLETLPAGQDFLRAFWNIPHAPHPARQRLHGLPAARPSRCTAFLPANLPAAEKET